MDAKIEGATASPKPWSYKFDGRFDVFYILDAKPGSYWLIGGNRAFIGIINGETIARYIVDACNVAPDLLARLSELETAVGRKYILKEE